MLDPQELSLLLTAVSNVLVIKQKGLQLSEDEYLFHKSCMNTIILHNNVKSHVCKDNLRKMKNADKAENELLEQDEIEQFGEGLEDGFGESNDETTIGG